MAMCIKHPFDQAAGSCTNCGEDFCAGDLVYSHGAQRPPFCISCALVAAGVRRGKVKASGGAGRGRIGLLAVVGAMAVVAVPVIAQLA